MTVTVNTVPLAVVVDVTVTSLDPDNEPDPIELSPTFNVTVPAVPENPPNLADILVTFFDEGRVVVKVILVAGLLLEPT